MTVWVNSNTSNCFHTSIRLRWSKWASAIKLSADGKFLYASNRAHNSIAVFKVVADGSLELIEIVPTQGLNPRDFHT